MVIFLDDERSSKEQDALAALYITDIDTTMHYVNQWMQRYLIDNCTMIDTFVSSC